MKEQAKLGSEMVNMLDVESSHMKYLEDREQLSEEARFEDFYLWPRTPIQNDLQKIIARRVGVSDYEIADPCSRPTRIIHQIKELLKDGLLDEKFSLLDIACGDAIVLWQIKKVFPRARCYGIDCNKGKFSTHRMVQQDGIRLYNVFIQHLFQTQVDTLFDVALMLNTYRGWESADLREHEYSLPELADVWFKNNARYVILTATQSQISRLTKAGFGIRYMGKGEDQSNMICISSFQLPKLPMWHFIKRWIK